nr:unnamed protein product [Digitaria exilis]
MAQDFSTALRPERQKPTSPVRVPHRWPAVHYYRIRRGMDGDNMSRGGAKLTSQVRGRGKGRPTVSGAVEWRRRGRRVSAEETERVTGDWEFGIRIGKSGKRTGAAALMALPDLL